MEFLQDLRAQQQALGLSSVRSLVAGSLTTDEDFLVAAMPVSFGFAEPAGGTGIERCDAELSWTIHVDEHQQLLP